MASEDDSREQGVEFGPLADDLEDAEYPMSKAELLETYGDRELELQDGQQTLRDVLEPLGETSFDSAEDVMQSTIGMVGDDAIGRKNYTDRGGEPSDDERNEESV